MSESGFILIFNTHQPPAPAAEKRTLLRFSLLSALAHAAGLAMLVFWNGGQHFSPPPRVIYIEMARMGQPQSRSTPRLAERMTGKVLPRKTELRPVLQQPAEKTQSQTSRPQPATTAGTPVPKTVVEAKDAAAAGMSRESVPTGHVGASQIAGSAIRSIHPVSAKAASAPLQTSVTAGQEARRGAMRSGYMQRCREMIERHKQYPLMARKGMLEGTVVLRGILARDGVLRQSDIIRSSGSSLLDNAALRAVRSVDRFPPLPPEVEGVELVFELPVSFRLSTE